MADAAVPARPAPDPLQRAADDIARPEASNPYASPGQVVEPSAREIRGELIHSDVEFEPTMRQTWRFFTDNFGPLALFGLVIFAINIALQVFGQVGGWLAEASGEPVVALVFFLFNSALGLFVQTYISLGSIIYILKMIRTRRAVIGDLFSANPYLVRGVGLMILIGLAGIGLALACFTPMGIALTLDESAAVVAGVAGGFVFAIVGIILWLRFGILSFYFLVDRNMSIGQSLLSSSRFMRGNKGTAFLLLFVVGLLGGLFVCVTCMLGQILYVPYFAVLLAAIYLNATGQPWSGSPAVTPPPSHYGAG